MHITSITTYANQTYMVVVSDEDDFDAVLPAQTVKYISVSDWPFLLHICDAPISTHTACAIFQYLGVNTQVQDDVYRVGAAVYVC